MARPEERRAWLGRKPRPSLRSHDVPPTVRISYNSFVRGPLAGREKKAARRWDFNERRDGGSSTVFSRWFLTAWRQLFRPRPLGARGEAASARHLKRLGYKILARGDRGRLGEIDLVALDGRTIVFVEVKTRESADSGHPSEAVDSAKRRRLTRLALSFLKRHHLLECPARFDIVAVTWPAGRHRPQIEHFKHAFEAEGRWQMHS